MSSSLLFASPTNLAPPTALHVSQLAPNVLSSTSPRLTLPYPLSLFTTSDAAEKWATYENLFYTCLRTGDEKSAFLCLEQLKKRFGEGNERVMGLVGLYHEAIAPDERALETVLKSYEEAIAENSTNLVVRKRHISLLKTLGRTDGAIAALVDLLDVVPVDAEAWSQLAEMYFAQGNYSQAVFCLEEVLLVTPNAWNIHARLAEIIYLFALAAGSEKPHLKGLTRSLKSFCRSIELCDDYLRGYYGLKMVTTKLQPLLQRLDKSILSKMAEDEDRVSPPSLKTVQRLDELATRKLAEIVRRHASGHEGWGGHEEAEVIAARELLARGVEKVSK